MSNGLLLTYFVSTGFGCAGRLYSPRCVILRIILVFLNLGLSAFDCYSDWQVWLTIREDGFGHPLLQLPTHWARAWLVFAALGSITAVLSVLNEASGILLFYRQYQNANEDIEKYDICKPCSAKGFNYITRAESLALTNICVEDLPLLILTLLFAAIQYSCNHPTPNDYSSIMKLVFVSSLASLLHVSWSLLRCLFRISLRACSHRSQTKSGSRTELETKITANELYPRHHRMKSCITCHSITMVAVYGITIGISVTAIAMTQHQMVLTRRLVDPSQELNVYRSHPQTQLLTNASSVIGNVSGVCLKEEFSLPDNQTITCDLTLLHSPEDSRIYFNFAVSDQFWNVTASVGTNSSAPVLDCSVFYENMFLGHNATSGVRRFDETCLGVLIIPNNEATLQRQRQLPILC